jgi:transcriptional regulator GlxA family with amidase domain
MQIAILALEGVFDTGITVTLDAFSMGTALSAKLFGGTPRFDVTIVGVRSKVRTAQGLTVPVLPMKSVANPDWVIIPAVLAGAPEELFDKLDRPDVLEAKSQLLKWSARGIRIGAACMGTFILAETGLLNQQEATTTWSLAPWFRQRFPLVQLDETRMVVPCDIGVTAGAAMGHLDLALWVIRQASPELANTVSRYLTADSRTSQAPFIIPNHLAQADPLIVHFERWARQNLKEGFSLQSASKALATSARTLQRRCDAVLGKSPLAYFQDLRVEHAQSLLHGDGHDIEAIAAEVGYSDGATLRTLLRERLGRGVREIRAGFQ